jgi:FKBP-type peptidyl-prolyl cis-trans isomerase
MINCKFFRFSLIKLLMTIFMVSSLISLAQPKIDCRFKKTKSGLCYKIIKKNKKGQRLSKSQRVFVTYDFYHKTDSTSLKLIIKNSKKSFFIGHDDVLKGWDEAVSILKVGDSAIFKIPPHLAYGNKKFGSILPNSTLYLFLRIDSVKNVFFNHAGKDTLIFQSGLKKIIVENSTGKKANPFNEVIIKFTAFVYGSNGHRQIFEETTFDKKNMLFQLGVDKFIKGLDEGITTMNIGEKSTFIVPPHLGYGDKQVGKILPNTTLYYDIELIDAKNPFFDISNKQAVLIEDSVQIIFIESKLGSLINNENIVQFDFKAYYKNERGYDVLFDNSFQWKKPKLLRPGSGKGFPGIENALLHLKKGDKATVLIPEKLIENKKKFPFFKKGDYVYFDLYVYDTFNYQFIQTSNQDTVVNTNGLKFINVQLGDGKEIRLNDKVKVAYSIYFYNNDGKRILLDASRERENWLEFIVGSYSNIKGFEMGVLGMKEGGLRRIIIPPSLGYGSEGMPERGIPSNTDLIVDIEGIRIIKE